MRASDVPSVRALPAPATSAVPTAGTSAFPGAGDAGAAGRVFLRPAPAGSRWRWRTTGMLLALLLLGALVGVSAQAHPGGAGPARLAAQQEDACAGPESASTCREGTRGLTPRPPTAPDSAIPSPGCVGEDCIPQPGTSAGSPDSGRGGHPDNTEDGGGGLGGPVCAITDLSGCVASAVQEVFRGIVTAAIAPIIDLLGAATLTTPTLGQLPGVGDLWRDSWQIVLAGYVLFVLVGGIVVMAHETLQTRSGIKEIAPRLVVGMLASSLSLFAADKMIRLANGLSLAILGEDSAAASLGQHLQDVLDLALDGGVFLLLLAVVLVVVGVGLVLVSVVRLVITLILLVAAPLCLACHALPATEGIARWWWKAFSFTLAIQIAQSLVLITATRTFLTGGVQSAQSPMTSTTSGAGLIIAALAMFYVLFKIPFWFLRLASGGSRSSLVGSLAKTYLFAKTLGMLGGRSGAGHAVTAAKPAHAAHSAATPAPAPVSASPARTVPRRERAQRHALHARLLRQRDAERVRAARTPRPASVRPTFLQPTPQDPARHAATGPASGKAPVLQFSSPPQPSRPENAPPTTSPVVRFRAPDTTPEPPRDSAPIRAAGVPAHLRFESPHPDAPGASTPIRRHDAPPAARFQPPPSETALPGGHVRPNSPTPPRFQPPPPQATARPRPSTGGGQRS